MRRSDTTRSRRLRDFVTRDGRRVAVTTSCAANLLGSVPSDAFACGNAESARRAFELLAQRIGGDAAVAARVLDIAAHKLKLAVDELDRRLRTRRQTHSLVGGGGGAGALVPYAAAAMHRPYRIARDAEVIAPIGVALALVRDVVERTIVSPTPGRSRGSEEKLPIA